MLTPSPFAPIRAASSADPQVATRIVRFGMGRLRFEANIHETIGLWLELEAEEAG